MNAITPPIATPPNATPTPSKNGKNGKGNLCKRPQGPTPEEAWDTRRPPTLAEREAFAAHVRRLEEQARTKAGIALDAQLDHYEQAALHRGVLQEALMERGILSMTRRRIAQRFYGQKAANIW